MRIRQGILRFSRIDQSQEFMHLKALRDIAQKTLQLCGGFREMACVILRLRFLELAVQPLGLVAACCHRQRATQENQTRNHPGPTSSTHGLHAITRRAAGSCRRTRTAAEKTLLRSAFSGKNATSGSVVQLQSELDLSRIVGSIASGSNFSEVRIRVVARIGDRDNTVATKIWSVEVRMIENVEELRPELHRETLAEPEVLE